jgi:uncharacterized protein YkwD
MLKKIFFLTILAAFAVYSSVGLRFMIGDGLLRLANKISSRDMLMTALESNVIGQMIINTTHLDQQNLDAAKAIAETNTQRSLLNVAQLTYNAQLADAAQKKLNDLFARQYFEHVSPDGHGPSWIAEQSGYKYAIVGENLALGDFKDEAALIDAWMNSPGHRANILNASYTDIGIAVARGEFEGRKVWIAVQEFGKPLSSCPGVDAATAASIEQDRRQIDLLGNTLTWRRNELISIPQATRDDQLIYNQKVNEYNKLVATYNIQNATLKNKIDTYNTEVKAFNACIKR